MSTNNMEIEDDKLYDITIAYKLMGYTSRDGVDYLIRKGVIHKDEIEIRATLPRGGKKIAIQGSAINRILKNPVYQRFSFRKGLRDDGY